MTYSAAKAQIEAVVEWLKGGETKGWDAQTAFFAECLSDLERQSRNPEWPDAPNLRAALPHAEEMLRFMRSQDRPATLETGLNLLKMLP